MGLRRVVCVCGWEAYGFACGGKVEHLVRAPGSAARCTWRMLPVRKRLGFMVMGLHMQKVCDTLQD